MQLVRALETKHKLKKGVEYNLDTDEKNAVLKPTKGKRVIFIPLELIGQVKLQEINAYN